MTSEAQQTKSNGQSGADLSTVGVPAVHVPVLRTPDGKPTARLINETFKECENAFAVARKARSVLVEAGQSALDLAIITGGYLREKLDPMPHGAKERWMRMHLEFSPSKARECMRLHREQHKLEEIVKSFNRGSVDLSINGALQCLSKGSKKRQGTSKNADSEDENSHSGDRSNGGKESHGSPSLDEVSGGTPKPDHDAGAGGGGESPALFDGASSGEGDSKSSNDASPGSAPSAFTEPDDFDEMISLYIWLRPQLERLERSRLQGLGSQLLAFFRYFGKVHDPSIRTAMKEDGAHSGADKEPAPT